MIQRNQTKEKVAIQVAVENGKVIAPNPAAERFGFTGLIRTPRLSDGHILSAEISLQLQGELRTFGFQEIAPLIFLCQAHHSVGWKLFVLHLKELADVPPERRTELLRETGDAVRKTVAFDLEGYVIPLLRSRDNIPLKSFAPDHDLITEEFTAELTILYGVSTDPSFGLLSPAFMEVEGLQREELRAHAIRSVKGLLVSADKKEGSDPLQIEAGGIFVSSLLLLEDLWHNQKFGFAGEIVVAIPALEEMFVADSNDPAAVERLQQKATAQFQQALWPITDKLFVMRNGRPQSYVKVK